MTPLAGTDRRRRPGRRWTAAAAGVAVAAALGGCAGTEDPAQAGFLDGMANLADGTYEDRQLRLSVEAYYREQRARAMAARADALERRAEGLADEAAGLERELAALDAELGALGRRLERSRQRHAAADHELEALEARLATVERRRRQAAADGTVDPAEIARLEEENRRIRESLNRLIALQSVVE